MNKLDILFAIEEIRQLKYRYFRFLDTHDWENFRTVWSPGAVMDVRDPNRILVEEGGVYVGPDEITEFARRAIGAGQTIDHALMPEIEILSPTTARAIWVVEDRLIWPAGHPNRSLHGHGHEHETYEKIDGRWYLHSSKLYRVKVDIVRAV